MNRNTLDTLRALFLFLVLLVWPGRLRARRAGGVGARLWTADRPRPLASR